MTTQSSDTTERKADRKEAAAAGADRDVFKTTEFGRQRVRTPGDHVLAAGRAIRTPFVALYRWLRGDAAR